MGTVKISGGNSKMGNIPSVSLPSVITCRQCACQEKCYARRLERLRPAVRNAYQHNLDVLNSDPETYRQAFSPGTSPRSGYKYAALFEYSLQPQIPHRPSA